MASRTVLIGTLNLRATSISGLAPEPAVLFPYGPVKILLGFIAPRGQDGGQRITRPGHGADLVIGHLADALVAHGVTVTQVRASCSMLA